MAEGKHHCCCWAVCFVIAGVFMSTSKCVSGEKKLRMVNMVYRHGDRSPTKTFPLDGNIKLWPQGLGQLTQIGMQQEYRLGKFIKNRYITQNKLLNTSYIRNQVYCRSTDYDRTIMSAQAQLNGLYTPQGRQVWRDGVKWQPIPIHVESKANDKILAHSNCPKYNELMSKSVSEPEYQAMKFKYKTLLQRLGPLLGYNESFPFKTAYSIYDILSCSQSHNFSIPSWANTTVMGMLKNISNFQMYWLFHSKVLARLKYGTGSQKCQMSICPQINTLLQYNSVTFIYHIGEDEGPLLGEMVQHMQSYKNKDKTAKKVYIYSAHDTTVSGLLSVLNLFDRVNPPYSSAVMLELYSSDETDDYTVRMFYRVGQRNQLRQLVLEGCDIDCPLDTFIKLTKSSIPENIDAACGVNKGICIKSIIYNSFLAAFAVTLAILLVLSICLCCCWCRYRRSVTRAARIDFDDGMLKDASLLNNPDYESD